MTNLAVPARTDYVCELLVGTQIRATITVSEMTSTISPTKSVSDYPLTESVAVSGDLRLFPSVS